MENSKIYMEPLFADSVSTETEGRQTYTTGKPSLGQLVELDAETINKVKQSVAELGKTLGDAVLADETEIEFSFGITGNGNICILSGSSSVGIKVTLKWNKRENIKN